MIYFDHNASSPARPEIIAAIKQALLSPGNASARHGYGRIARKLVEDARDSIALAMGVCARDLIFTGSGTESINSAVYSAVKSGASRLYISAMDHPASVLMAEDTGAQIEIIPAQTSGLLDINWLSGSLARHDHKKYGRPFISIAIANSETGTIQDIGRIIDIARDNNALLLLDAVQALGKIPMNLAALADYVAVSAHKIGGPQGVGALYVAEDAPFFPLLIGGGQEKRRRAGTLNVAGIAGFGAAAKQLEKNLQQMQNIQILRDKIETGLSNMESELVVFGQNAPRLPNTSFFAVPGKQADILMMALDLQGICVSTGIACSSGKAGASRAITAMGLQDKAKKGAIRISLGPGNTKDEAEEFLRVWADIRKKPYKGAA